MGEREGTKRSRIKSNAVNNSIDMPIAMTPPPRRRTCLAKVALFVNDAFKSVEFFSCPIARLFDVAQHERRVVEGRLRFFKFGAERRHVRAEMFVSGLGLLISFLFLIT